MKLQSLSYIKNHLIKTFFGINKCTNAVINRYVNVSTKLRSTRRQ